ncbi:MAG: hypothetical protein AAGE59_05180 [Cyanobacteria bacterium P01_F01_bin.86]
MTLSEAIRVSQNAYGKIDNRVFLGKILKVLAQNIKLVTTVFEESSSTDAGR